MVRPVDNKYSILQSTPMEKIQTVQQRQSDMQQRYFNLQLAEEKRQDGEKIRSMEQEKPELVKNTLEREEKRGTMDQQKSAKKDDDQQKRGKADVSEEEEWYEEPLSGSYINLKV